MNLVYPNHLFDLPTTTVAEKLIGMYLVSFTQGVEVIGKIIETEAYLSENDFASHSYMGMTTRNAAMFGDAGTLYLYRIYGLHICCNIVTTPKNSGEAVLIRALEPLKGIEAIQKRRQKNIVTNLCNGPANLVVALGLSMNLNGISLKNGQVQLLEDPSATACKIKTSSRIGISKSQDLLLRFYLD